MLELWATYQSPATGGLLRSGPKQGVGVIHAGIYLVGSFRGRCNSEPAVKSATRWQPANGGSGEIPEPTVKVRMRGSYQGTHVPFFANDCALCAPNIWRSHPGFF